MRDIALYLCTERGCCCSLESAFLIAAKYLKYFKRNKEPHRTPCRLKIQSALFKTCEWSHTIYRPPVNDCAVLLLECRGVLLNYFAARVEIGVLWWWTNGITSSTYSLGGGGDKQNGKSIKQKAGGGGGLVAAMQEVSSPPLRPTFFLSFNLLTAISCLIGKRVLCASMPPTIARSRKKKWRFRRAGCFIIFFCMYVVLH
jgi:hypothetical protein